MDQGQQPPPFQYQPPAGQQPPQQSYPTPGGQPPPYQPPTPAPAPGSQVPQPPQQFQPPAAQPGGPGAAKKKSFPVWGILLILSIPLLLIGGCVGALVLSARGPINTTNDFLAEVQAGDFAGAEALVGPGCGITSVELMQFFEGDTITGYNISGVQWTNGELFTYGTISFQGAGTRDIEFFHRDDMICGITYDVTFSVDG